MPTHDYDTILSKLSSYREEVQSLRQLKDDTARLNRAIVNYQNVFRIMSEQKEFNRKEAEQKPKRFGIGPVAGYGVSGTGLNSFFGIGITYSIIKF